MKVIKRLVRYYYAEIILTVGMLLIALAYTYEPTQLVSAIARKVALASAGLILYYVSRLAKVSVIDWDEEWRKKYAMAIFSILLLSSPSVNAQDKCIKLKDITKRHTKRS